jgi:hypothetical protein
MRKDSVRLLRHELSARGLMPRDFGHRGTPGPFSSPTSHSPRFGLRVQSPQQDGPLAVRVPLRP